MPVDLKDYNTVAMRIAEFRAKHPQGSLRPVNLDEPFRVLQIGDRQFICYTAAAYRSPEDTHPGVGVAWEPFPGRTPYTKDSELMNAETSAWGRAIVAVLAADTVAGIATREEIENRRAEQEAAPKSSAKPSSSATARTSPVRTSAASPSEPILPNPDLPAIVKQINAAKTADELNKVWKQAGELGVLTTKHEGKTIQQLMYDRGDAIKSSKSS